MDGLKFAASCYCFKGKKAERERSAEVTLLRTLYLQNHARSIFSVVLTLRIGLFMLP